MRRTLAGVAVLICAGVGRAGEPLDMKGRVDAVTVYRGQALVTRVVELGRPTGLHEVIVTDLPESVVPGSIFAESADGVEVRSVRYRTRPVSQDVREEVRKLDEQIRGLQDSAEATQRQLAVLETHKAYLAKLEQFVAPTATVELTRGVLNADTLKVLSTYLLEQRQQITVEELKRGLEQRGFKEQIELLQRQREQLAAGSARTVREAVVFVNLKDEGGCLRVRYLVDRATWTPFYNVRTGTEGKQVQVEYYASIQQMSGEDWGDVNMTLSTATPSLTARAPSLAPLHIALAALQAGGKGQPEAGQRALDASGYAAARDELLRRKSALENQRNQPAPAQQQRQQVEVQQQAAAPQAIDLDVSLNSIATEMQILDVLARGVKGARPSGRSAGDETVSVTYQLASRTSMPSRSDQQLIQIASMPMTAEFYKVAIPLLTSFVYNEAGVTNTSRMVLLAGPVTAYSDGQFVGQGEIPTVAAGEDFTVGFGIDTSLRAGRELADKTESIQGGNRVVEFTYRLSVENFGTAPAKVRLVDRLPVSKENDVRVELVSTGGRELSKDAAYQQNDRKKGILRWEVEVAPQSIGPKAFTLDHKHRLEYDKQMGIAGTPMASR